MQQAYWENIRKCNMASSFRSLHCAGPVSVIGRRPRRCDSPRLVMALPTSSCRRRPPARRAGAPERLRVQATSEHAKWPK
eukprot:15451056-Alexandrium_andersonii.AAC.1